jgi:peroxin-3
MFDAVKRWFNRNRNNLLIGASVIGAGYLTGQYVLSKLHEARVRMSEEKISKENLRRRFEQNQDDCTYTVLALLPTVRDEIVAALPVEQISEQLQQERQERLRRIGASEAGSSEFPSAAPSTVGDDGKSLTDSFLHASQVASSNADITGAGAAAAAARPKRSKAQLWQDMKINSIARALTLIYSLSLLTLLTRIQLNLLGRRTYLSSVVALASPPSPAQASRISLENHDDDNYDNAYGNDFETNRKYLTFSWWLLHRGSRQIMARVIAAVKEVFAQVNIREDVSLESLSDLIMRVRKIVEGSTEEERRSTKWLEYLLPPAEDEVFVIRQSGTSEHSGSGDGNDGYSSPEQSFIHAEDPSTLINASLRRLLDETADLIDSPTFSFVLTRVLDAAYSHLIDNRIAVEVFHVAPPAPPVEDIYQQQPRITELSTATCKLAHILPAFCKQAHAIAVGSGELDATLAGVAAQGANGLALGNEYLAAVDKVPDLAAFAALVYSSNWEYEPLEQQQVQLQRAAASEKQIDAQAQKRLQEEVDEEEELEIIEMVKEAALRRDDELRRQNTQQQNAGAAPAATENVEESAVLVPKPIKEVGENVRDLAGEAKHGLEAAWQKATSASTSILPEQSPEKVESVVRPAVQQQSQPSNLPQTTVKEFSDPETAIPAVASSNDKAALEPSSVIPSETPAAATVPATATIPAPVSSSTIPPAALYDPSTLQSSAIPAPLQGEIVQPPALADGSVVPATPGAEDVVALPEYLPEVEKKE